MSIFEPIGESWRSRLLSVLRIVAAFLFIAHGTQKIFGVPPSNMPAKPFVLASQMGLAGVLETFGGSLVLIGFLTRPVAFLLSGEMAVAYFQAHAPHGFLPLVNHGEVPVLFCFLYLYLAAAGGGSISVDALLARRRRAGHSTPHDDHTAPLHPRRDNLENRRRDAV